jgi:hypothetical protein
VISDFGNNDELEFVVFNSAAHVIEGTSFGGGFSLANQTAGGSANAITVSSKGSGGTSIAGADVVIFNAGLSGTMNEASKVDQFLAAQNGTFSGGVLVVAYAHPGSSDVVGLYYDADASSVDPAGITLLVTFVGAGNGALLPTSLSAADFDFIV